MMARRAFSRTAITRRLFNTPLAVTSETAAIVLGAIGQRFDVSQLFVANDGQRLGLGELEGMAAERRLELESRANVDHRAPKIDANRLMPVINGVGFVEVRGELVAENGIGPASGFTGYDGVRAQVLGADNDPTVRGIVLDIDSPGGEVAGLYECCAALMARRGKKPMRAVIRGVGASAACALSICADEVTIHELGYGGSVGTIMMHVDYSQALANEGTVVTLIAAGEHKADGNPFEPLPEAVAARFKALCESANDKFIAHVAEARGIDPAAVRAQQAQVFQGEEAVQAGLADKVMSWADSIAEFTAAVNGGGSGPAGGAPGARSQVEKQMDPNTTAPAAEAQPVTEQQLNQARTEAQTAERERVAALFDLDAESTISDSLKAAIADGTSAGAFAIALNKASREAGAQALGGLQADAVTPSALPSKDAKSGGGGGDDKPVNRGQSYAERKKAQAKA